MKKLFVLFSVMLLSVALTSGVQAQETSGAAGAGTTAAARQDDDGDDDFDLGWLGLLGLLGLAGLIPRKRHDHVQHTGTGHTATRA
ncbi:MAG TPA: WGxxGxxG family protein [Pirellulaceae bacterium]|jgi:hypothetical protein|nr:WGxxGxxG family protein [Pirellulaceae bacterium]